ncbi:putative nuclease HARBI1 [Antedon mediterranea]|uniref:putative nuclease HARBI1 n=1 Tax=Antedon mediterranea TaxID=105859 RepID=UPI003AF6C8AD
MINQGCNFQDFRFKFLNLPDKLFSECNKPNIVMQLREELPPQSKPTEQTCEALSRDFEIFAAWVRCFEHFVFDKTCKQHKNPNKVSDHTPSKTNDDEITDMDVTLECYESLDKETFKYVVDELRPHIGKSDNNNGPTFSAEWRVAMTLYRLSTGMPFNKTANQFGCAKSTACTVYHEVCEAIEAVLMPKFINFPTGQQLKKNMEKFKIKGGFPQVVGAIDGTHIAIIAPRDQSQDYFNRKEYFSIVLQGVVDADGMFINTFCDMPGSVNDARVFNISNFGERLKDKSIFEPYIVETVNNVQVPPLILGDGAYPLLQNLMRPFPNRPNRQREHARFNYKLSQCRVIVEHAFGRLKGRWRILLKRNEHEIQKLRPVIQACCTLHNICASNGVPYQPHWTDDEVRASLGNHHNRMNPITEGPRAEQIRSAIIQELMKET